MMEEHTLSFWIYLGVLSMFVFGATKKILASYLSPAPTLVAWLGATVLVERLWTSCLPPLLVLVLFAITCCLYAATRIVLQPATLPAHGKAVFITGCDSGFGNETVKRLDALGFEVFATVLDLTGPGARELQSTCSSRLTLFQVDITQTQQVQQALLDTKAKLGVRGLWGLVNNAGLCVNFGDAELSLMSNFRSCMEINFFGTVSVTKSFLPLLRQAKGRLITICSPAGDQPFPCLSAYGASKAALSLFVNTLRHELKPWGVKVSTILPSSYKTGQCRKQSYWNEQHKQLLQSLSPELLEDYGEDYVSETKELFERYVQHANSNLSPVVDTIVQALLCPKPRARYLAGPGVGLMYFIHTYCPLSISSRFLQKLFVKKKLLPRALRKQSSFDLNLSLYNNNNEEERLK
ncbi:11-beta-hydroxysteroid dehydrogenase type 2 [Echeneis naucrates]|uniref:11-beta-hydroxysteroid dehydrogenase type 2 n=1 Tax=Echeneis naucrates TaxID=173247 RepID=A0A665WXC9_ECHNA|nr:corticosteroid 11-beta-dehydrogenase isozyme 2 [Echeneis naucrates]